MFEKDLNKIYREYISLCHEFTVGLVDTYHIYIYQDEDSRLFNCFFTRDGKMVSVADQRMGIYWYAFKESGLQDIQKLIDTYKKYDKSCPNEIRLIYSRNTRQLQVEDKFVTYPDSTECIIFRQWESEVQNRCN